MEMLLILAVKALTWLIILDVILSWVMPDETKFPRNLTREITTPLYAPIQKILNPQRTGGFDLSPLIILILLNVMESMLRGH